MHLKSLRFLVVGCVVLLVFSGRPSGASEVLRFAAVGDVMMGTTWPTEILPPRDAQGVFDSVIPAFRGSDLVFGNLEGPMVEGGGAGKCGSGSEGRCYEFRMPRRYAARLSEAGFHVMNVANNHAFDFGLAGVESTLEALEGVGIQACGGERVARFTLRGRRVAWVGFSASPPSRYAYSLLDLERARQLVRQLTAEGNFVVVSFHGGAEGKGALHVSDTEEIFLGERRGNVLRFARAMVDEGARLVLGHGPHVPRAMEVYRGKLIAYSLGNFLTYGRFNTKGPNGMGYVLRADLDAESGDFAGGSIASVVLSEAGLPSLDPEGRAAGLIRTLTAEDVAGGHLNFGPEGRFRPSAAWVGRPAVSGGLGPEIR